MIPLRDENPTRHFPVVTILLLAANGYIFFQSVIGGIEGLRYTILEYGIVPRELIQHPVAEYTTLISATFIHAGWAHLLGNMLYLWIFGNNIEDVLGKVGFILFYATCGIIASFSHIAIDLDSQIPMVGASGAISGILGGYILLFPKARVLTLVFLGFYINLIRIPAVILLTLWILLQIGNTLLSGPEGGGWPGSPISPDFWPGWP